MAKKVKKVINEDETENTLSSEINELNTIIKTKDENVQTLEQQMLELQKLLTNQNQEIDSLKNNVVGETQSLTEKINSLEENLHEKTNKIDIKEKKIVELEKNLNLINKTREKEGSKNATKLQTINAAYENEAAKLNEQITKLTARAQELEKRVQLEMEEKSKHINEKKSMENTHTDLTKSHDKMEGKYKKVYGAYKSIKQEKEAFEKEIIELKEKCESSLDRHSQMENKILKLQQKLQTMINEKDDLHSNLKEHDKAQYNEKVVNDLNRNREQTQIQFQNLIDKLAATLNINKNEKSPKKIANTVMSLVDEYTSLEAKYLRKTSESEEEKKKLESQQKKMMKLIKDLRSQKKDSQNSSKDQNIQIRTYENSLETMQVEISRSLSRWKEFRKSDVKSPRPNKNATLESVVIESIRQLTMNFKMSMDLCKQSEEKQKKLSHSMEKKIGKLQREREELKGNVKELTTEMETHRENWANVESEAKTLRQAAADGWIPNLPPQCLVRHEVLLRVALPANQINNNDKNSPSKKNSTENENENKKIAEENLSPIIYCLISVPTPEDGIQIFWTTQDQFLSKFGLEESTAVLPDLVSVKVEQEIKRKFDAKWVRSVKRFDQAISKLENELNKVRKEKEKIGSDFKKYKKRAGQILETQKKKGEETEKDVEDVKSENENLKDIIIKLEEKLSEVEVETLQTQINRLQQNLRQLQSEFELSESRSQQYQSDASGAEEKLSDLQALHESTLKKREKSKEEMKRKFTQQYDDMRDSARKMLAEKDEELTKLRTDFRLIETRHDSNSLTSSNSHTYLPQPETPTPTKGEILNPTLSLSSALSNENISNPPFMPTNTTTTSYNGQVTPIIIIPPPILTGDADDDLLMMANQQKKRELEAQTYQERIRHLQNLLQTHETLVSQKDEDLNILSQQLNNLKQVPDAEQHADNLAYLKNAISSYLLGKGDPEPLLNVIFTVLHFSRDERQRVREHLSSQESIISWIPGVSQFI